MHTKAREEKAFKVIHIHHMDVCLFHPLVNQLQRAVNGAHSLKRPAWTFPFNTREREYRQVYLGNFASALKGKSSPIKPSSTF